MLNTKSRARGELDKESKRVNDWKMVAGMLFGLLILQGFVSYTRQNDITVHVPPDLSGGAMLKAGSIPKPNVYLFASEVWRSVNYWDKDGDKDMERNLNQYKCYLTDRARQQQLDLHAVRVKEGMASGRTRSMTEIMDLKNIDAAVINLGAGTWDVDLDFRLVESLRGTVVKDQPLRYRVRVAADNSASNCNPFNMRITAVNQPLKIEFAGSGGSGE